MADAFGQLSSQLPDGFGALLTKSREAAQPDIDKAQRAEE